MERVVNFVDFVLRGVVESPEFLKVVADVQTPQEACDQMGLKKAVLFIYTSDADCGRVIGKQGKMIRAIRTLVTAVSGKDGYRWIVSVVKSEEQSLAQQNGGSSGSSIVSV